MDWVAAGTYEKPVHCLLCMLCEDLLAKSTERALSHRKQDTVGILVFINY